MRFRVIVAITLLAFVGATSLAGACCMAQCQQMFAHAPQQTAMPGMEHCTMMADSSDHPVVQRTQCAHTMRHAADVPAVEERRVPTGGAVTLEVSFASTPAIMSDSPVAIHRTEMTHAPPPLSRTGVLRI